MQMSDVWVFGHVTPKGCYEPQVENHWSRATAAQPFIELSQGMLMMLMMQKMPVCPDVENHSANWTPVH